MGRAISKELRDRALAMVAKGASYAEAGAACGVSKHSVYAWERQRRKTKPGRSQRRGGAFRPLRIVAARPALKITEERGFAIDGPDGLRVAGLGIEDLAVLFAKLAERSSRR